MMVNFKKIPRILKTAGTVVMMGALLVLNGCGGGSDGSDSDKVTTTSKQLTASEAKVNVDGTLTTLTSITVKDANDQAVLEIPADAVMTGEDENGNTVNFTSLPEISVSIPSSSVASGKKAPLGKSASLPTSIPREDIYEAAGFVNIYVNKRAIKFKMRSGLLTVMIPIQKVDLLKDGAVYISDWDNVYSYSGQGTIITNPSTGRKAVSIKYAATSIKYIVDPVLKSGSAGGTP